MNKKLLQVVGITLTVSFIFSTAVLAVGPENIDWNKPVPIAERIMGKGSVQTIPADLEGYGVSIAGKKGMLTGYKLPQGWEEATRGVDNLVLLNSGGMSYDPATVLNAKIFEKMTGIHLKFLETEDMILWPKTLSVLMAKSSKIDIITCSNLAFDFPHLIAAGWLHPIDVLYPPEVRKLYPKDLLQDMIGNDGKAYGAPLATWGMFLFYRPSWLAKAGVTVPKTWQELVVTSKKVDEWVKANLGPGYAGMIYPAASLDMLRQLWAMPTYAQGKRIRVNEKTVIDPATWELITNLWLKGGMSKSSIEYTWSSAPEVFAKGKAGFTITGSVYMDMFADPEFGTGIQDDWDVTLMPAWEGIGVRGRIQSESDSWGINPFIPPAKIAAAMLWMDYQRSYQGQFNELYLEGNESAVSAVYDHPAIKEKVTYIDLRKTTLRRVISEKFLPGMPHALSIFKEYLDKTVLGEMNPTPAFEKAQQEINELF